MPTAVRRRYPKLVEALGDALLVEDYYDPTIKRHVAELAKVPPEVLARLRAEGMTVHIAARSVPDLDDNGELRGVQPPGWPEGSTWDEAAGAYNHTHKGVSAGLGRHDEESLILHEIGHAAGHLFNLENDPRLIAHHRQLFDELDPYLQGDGPGDYFGRRETLSECIMVVLLHGRREAERRFNRTFVDFVVAEVLELKP